MKRLLDPFLDLLLLRAGPQRLPPSTALLLAAMLASLGSSLLLARETFEPGVAIGRTLLDLGLTALLLLVLLRSYGLQDRFVQSFTAACGTGAILSLLTWPLFRIVLDSGGDEGGGAAVAMLGVWAILAWNVAVIGHILRHALDTSFGRGIGLALVYVVLVTLAGEALLPAAETD